MEQRKYFKHGIQQLEELYSGAGGNFALLEELEEELQHRSTQRAKQLLSCIQESLKVDSVSPEPANVKSSPPNQEIKVRPNHVSEDKRFDKDAPIDWNAVLSGVVGKSSNTNAAPEAKLLKNSPQDILDTWTVLEALSPQSYKKPDDLVVGQGNVAYLRHGQEPWLQGEKSRPKANLYYLVYLGSIDLKQATEKLLQKYQDKRVERPSAKGLAALGVIMLDKKGIPIPETGLALSSFGWSYGRALEGKLDELRYWEKAENALKEGLQKIVFLKDSDGNPIPFTFALAELAHQWLIKNCGIPENDVVAPSFAVRLFQPFSKGEPETPLLNSFFLDDLQRVKAALNERGAGKALSQYMGCIRPNYYHDVLQNKSHIETALQPKNTPSSRWPGKGRHPLVLLQQMAVNLAVKELQEGGLFSVNGPPGTGKTTLLRDVVASVVVNRAKTMSAFKNPEEAFSHSGQLKIGGAFVHLYQLHESLRGHEIVVASTNNKAVENVSRELPLQEQIAEDLSDLNYFKTVSDALSEGNDETWGLIAAVLGNATNKSAFINKAWWDENSGLKNYFLSITGQIDLKPDDNGEVHIPRIIEECNPPKDLAEAKLRWAVARQSFIEALRKSESAIKQAQLVFESQKQAFLIQEDIQKNRAQRASQKMAINLLTENKHDLHTQLTTKKDGLVRASKKVSQSIDSKPGWFKRIFERQGWKKWKEDHETLRLDHAAVDKECTDLDKKINEAAASLESANRELSELVLRGESLERSLGEKSAIIRNASSICGDGLVTSELWLKEHEEQQMFAPNFTAQAQRLRDDVFVAAIKLHKAFIDASAKQMRQNLGAFFFVLNGGGLPPDKQGMLSHLWSTLFILTPVISTAFASVGRMLKYLPAESIGWLLIDEAGQATPQAAVGAIYRAKRVMSVGDPLQIEPVVTLPAALVEGFSKYMGVDPFHWAAPAASVQSVSDNSNAHGTTIPRDLSEIRIGTPLLVHRRCENPMFRISNTLAYAGLMVHATVPKPSNITDVFGVQVCWFDIAGSAQEKWCPEEGDMVADMLLKASSVLNGDPDIFVITPFRVVAERMRRRMMQESEKLKAFGIEDPDAWVRGNIGTVHTFQGKEAKAVIFLLGAPDPAQNGARSWATSNVNLLNVAVSRAKQNFYVVGNKTLWGSLGNMKLVSKYVP